MRQTAAKGSPFRKPQNLLQLGSALLTTASLTGIPISAIAQSTLPACQPPRASEYLVLVVSETKESQAQIRQAVPANSKITVCKYLDNVVTRVGGFSRSENANNWVRYMNDIVGLQAFIARPPTRQASASINVPSASQLPTRQAPASTNSSSVYQPKPLGSGYAVLVDYANQPQLATQVRQLLGRNVGLVSYGQRPYLLAVYTPNQSQANSTLQRLSDRGFLTMLVDSRRVTLLRQQVLNP